MPKSAATDSFLSSLLLRFPVRSGSTSAFGPRSSATFANNAKKVSATPAPSLDVASAVKEASAPEEGEGVTWPGVGALAIFTYPHNADGQPRRLCLRSLT